MPTASIAVFAMSLCENRKSRLYIYKKKKTRRATIIQRFKFKFTKGETSLLLLPPLKTRMRIREREEKTISRDGQREMQFTWGGKD